LILIASDFSAKVRKAERKQTDICQHNLGQPKLKLFISNIYVLFGEKFQDSKFQNPSISQ